MCGIIGLLARTTELRSTLGRMIVPMFRCMAERGPDSAGLAVFREPPASSRRKVSLHARRTGYDFAGLEQRMRAELDPGALLRTSANGAVVEIDVAAAPLRAWISEKAPELTVLSIGSAIELFKDQGRPEDVLAKYEFVGMTGSHAVGHTRMATESAVSPAHAHPFTAGEDFCLVHNGSLSNPYKLRRRLEAEGVRFETDNDSEAACRYLEWRLSRGDSLEVALERALTELDGFYTFLIGTRNSMSLLRDPAGCKPAIVAETDAYVAVSSEYRSFAHLPGIGEARIFEPLPERIYSWQI